MNPTTPGMQSEAHWDRVVESGGILTVMLCNGVIGQHADKLEGPLGTVTDSSVQHITIFSDCNFRVKIRG